MIRSLRRSVLRLLCAVPVLLNLALPAACQTSARNNAAGSAPVPVPSGQSPVSAVSASGQNAAVWNGVPGPFKAAVVGTLRPGEPFVAAAAGTGVSAAAKGQARMQAALVRGDKQLNRGVFFSLGETSRRGPVCAAVMAVPSTVTAGPALLRITAGGKVLASLEVTILERIFETETINITGTMTDLLTKPDPEKTRQAEQMWAVWARTGDEIYTPGNFIMPVNSQVQTSRFGGRRVYKYPDGRTSPSIHAGVDWRAPTGTPISAPAPGRVALAASRIVTGNTVVLEHMPGVYSLYYHMDKITVAEGDMVEAGTKLGEAGATGFATGAHLHWELRVATENTDPASFLGRKILDKDAILAILNE